MRLESGTFQAIISTWGDFFVQNYFVPAFYISIYIFGYKLCTYCHTVNDRLNFNGYTIPKKE